MFTVWFAHLDRLLFFTLVPRPPILIVKWEFLLLHFFSYLGLGWFWFLVLKSVSSAASFFATLPRAICASWPETPLGLNQLVPPQSWELIFGVVPYPAFSFLALFCWETRGHLFSPLWDARWAA